MFKGDVWSFTVEPLSHALASVIATASSFYSADMGPEKTIDGSGLDVNDAHSTQATDMWLSHPGDTDRWIQYEFALPQKLDKMWVWNSNQSTEYLMHLGAKDVAIETSIDRVSWTPLADAPEFASASSSPEYTCNTVVDFKGVVAKYVKLHLQTGYGLSEVRFFAIPVHAADPELADGSTTDRLGITLRWRSGRDADAHEVVLSSDRADLEDGSAVPTPVWDNTFSPTGLDYDTTYYWRINEIHDAEIPARYAGPIWSFTTPPYVLVDDFESYRDMDFEEIWHTWEDGYKKNDNGSIVGDGNIGDTTVVHQNSGQSMPLYYDNTSAAISEATRTFDSAEGMDWSRGSLQTLVLYVHGDPGNTGGQLYVKINGFKVPFNGNPAALFRPFWTQWNVELDAVTTDLSHIRTLTIGVENAGAQGVVYVDDIRVYRQAPAGLPQDPGAKNLVAHYPMEGDAQDNSGNGNHGTPIGNPLFGPGMTGMAVDFDGFDDRIELGTLDIVGSGITLAAWLNPVTYVYDDTRVISKATSVNTKDHWWMLSTEGRDHVLRFRLKTAGGGTTTLVATDSEGVPTGEWTHAAATWDGNTMRIYQNLQEIASTTKVGTAVAVDPAVAVMIGNQPFGAGDKHWRGLIDEMRIYNRRLSEAELCYIALE